MNQRSINDWFSIPSKINTSIELPSLFKKYFYLDWINYDNYNIYWTDIKPLKFNFEKKVKLRQYKEEIIFIGNIEYNKECCSLILNKKSFTSSNISFLKSHLQKCIRRGLIYKSIVTAYLLMENNITEFLRRLPIIILEDVHIIQDLDIIVWFMALSESITIPESFSKLSNLLSG